MIAAIDAESGGGFMLYVSLIVASTVHSACENLHYYPISHRAISRKLKSNHSLSADDGPLAVVKPNRAIFFLLRPGSVWEMHHDFSCSDRGSTLSFAAILTFVVGFEQSASTPRTQYRR